VITEALLTKPLGTLQNIKELSLLLYQTLRKLGFTEALTKENIRSLKLQTLETNLTSKRNFNSSYASKT
jgi:hypothetical protein